MPVSDRAAQQARTANLRHPAPNCQVKRLTWLRLGVIAAWDTIIPPARQSTSWAPTNAGVTVGGGRNATETRYLW
jgi:hypothetical protein